MTTTPAAGRAVQPIELRTYYTVLRARWYWVVAGALVGLALAAAWWVTTPPVYEATTTVLLRPLTANLLQQLENDTKIDTSTERQIARSLEIAELTLGRLETPSSTSATELVRPLSVEAAEDAEVLRFTYKGGDPATTAERANAFASAYLVYRENRARDALSEVESNLEERLAAILTERAELEAELDELAEDTNVDGEPDGSPVALRSVEARLTVLQTRQALAQTELEELSGSSINGGAVISSALPPATPSGLTLPVVAAMGLTIGALAGIVLVFLRNSLEATVTHGDLAQELLGVPALGFIEDPHPHRSVRLNRHTADAALRRAAASLDAVASDKTTVVVLPVGEAATAQLAARGLAAGLAAHHDVVVVEANGPRRKVQSESVFDQVSRQSRAATRPSWVQVTPQGEPDRVDLADPSAGSDLPNRPESAVRHLNGYYDVVVVATPPLTQATDALHLADAPGTVVVPVIRLGTTRRDELPHVRRDLRTAGANVVGLLVIGPRRAWGNNSVNTPATGPLVLTTALPRL